MPNLIDAGAALANKWIGIVFGIFLGILIVGAFASALWENKEHLVEAGSNLIEYSCIANAKLNGVNLELENLTQDIIDDLPTDTWEQLQVKVILQKSIEGESITDNEYMTLIENLSRWHKLKFNLDDLEVLCSFLQK